MLQAHGKEFPLFSVPVIWDVVSQLIIACTGVFCWVKACAVAELEVALIGFVFLEYPVSVFVASGKVFFPWFSWSRIVVRG